jgi:hypothetical protein
MDAPFPDAVEKGETYGKVDAVLVDADISGWASRVAAGGRLDPIDAGRLRAMRDDLRASLPAFPPAARPYYETVLAVATAALQEPTR